MEAGRVSGVNENITILLMAAKFQIPVCPHAGGVGLCEIVQHHSMFDYVAVSANIEEHWIEFVDPVRVVKGRYLASRYTGSGAAMYAESVADFEYPQGAKWKAMTTSS